MRPPSVPLIVHDPYFSAWSPADTLAGAEVCHWTGAGYGTDSLIRIDGTTYRLMGSQPHNTEPLAQTGVTVLPTRTVATFEGAGVGVTLTFLSPLLPEDLDLLSRPLAYVIWDVKAIDGKSHSVQLYLHFQGQWVVDSVSQQVDGSRFRTDIGDVVRLGSKDQHILERVGDNTRIDWGYLYLVSGSGSGEVVVSTAELSRTTFLQTGAVPQYDDMSLPCSVNSCWPVLAASFDLGDITSNPVTRFAAAAYDDIFSLEYLNRRLRPYWKKPDFQISDLIHAGVRDFEAIKRRCESFDSELMSDLEAVGGKKYAELAALSFRQSIAAHKLAVDIDGTPVFFSKENFSNGCINTVDVTYPSSPFFLLFNPVLLKAQITAILDYAQSIQWKFPFAPHDLGTYPQANGQVYGGGERTERDQMPVEECGNMLVLTAAYVESSGDLEYGRKYWPLLRLWADYLLDKGLDPENQLCTDDFAGHLAHNVNLSLKAIVGLGAFAKLGESIGRAEEASAYMVSARGMAAKWVEMANDGDHYRLAFDVAGSWSQKYNLVWDVLLGLGLFPKSVAETEVAFYLKKIENYGLPLDSRHDQAKLDWSVWSACLAENHADFLAIVEPLYKFADESPSRVPLTDWYSTVTGKQIGFQARSVVGGVFIKLLYDKSLRAKWLGRALRN